MDLHQRMLDGLGLELELFGSSDAGRMLRLPGVVASISPGTPGRSLFNSVSAVDRAALEDAYEELVNAYERAGVSAWTVWVPDRDRETAQFLQRRGHQLDSWPRSMALELDDLAAGPAMPDGYSLVEGDLDQVGRLNDLAYAEESPVWIKAIGRDHGLDLQIVVAERDEEPVSCALVIKGEDDVCVTCVATLEEHRGRGLAGAIIVRLLSESRARGIGTGSLQASALGSPVYQRLGFTDLGFIEMWEQRTCS